MKTSEKVVNTNKSEPLKSELRFIYTSLLICVVIPLVLALTVGHVSGYYEGFSHLEINFSIPDTLFAILTPVMFGVFGLSLHFVIISSSSTHNNYKLSLSLWTAAFLFSLSWMIIFFTASLTVLSFVWIGLAFAISAALSIINFKVNKTAAVLSVIFTLWIGIITYIVMLALVV